MSKLICPRCLYPLVPVFKGAKEGKCQCFLLKPINIARELDLEFLLDQIRMIKDTVDHYVDKGD